MLLLQKGSKQVPGNGRQTDKGGHRPRPRVLREGCGRKLGAGVEGELEGGGRQERPNRGDYKQSPGERAGGPVSGAFNVGEQTVPQGLHMVLHMGGVVFGLQGQGEVCVPEGLFGHHVASNQRGPDGR